MQIGVPRELSNGETLVALTPDTVKRLRQAGLEVSVETQAGQQAGFADEAYQEAGAVIAETAAAIWEQSGLVLKVRGPLSQELPLLRADQVLIALLDPLRQPQAMRELAQTGVSALSMERMPRITRAQNMDALSAMATVAGYKAVLLAANRFPRFFPMFMTAAGTIPPARALILGAGVAGLQAIATAKRLGAVVEAFDARPVVKEQVESLGARFLSASVSAPSDRETSGGYARALGEDEQQKDRDLIATRLPRTDIVITTAQVPGKKAPLLLTESMVELLKPGSVVVDLAAASGGNVAFTQADATRCIHGVSIIGATNLPALMPTHASQMYARTLLHLVLHLQQVQTSSEPPAETPPAESAFLLSKDDAITAAILVTHQKELLLDLEA